MEIAKEEAEQRELDSMHALESMIATKLELEATVQTLREQQQEVDVVRVAMQEREDALRVRPHTGERCAVSFLVPVARLSLPCCRVWL